MLLKNDLRHLHGAIHPSQQCTSGSSPYTPLPIHSCSSPHTSKVCGARRGEWDRPGGPHRWTGMSGSPSDRSSRWERSAKRKRPRPRSGGGWSGQPLFAGCVGFQRSDEGGAWGWTWTLTCLEHNLDRTKRMKTEV